MVFFTVDASCCENNKICWFALQHHYQLLDYFQDKKGGRGIIAEYEKKKSNILSFGLFIIICSFCANIYFGRFDSELTGEENERALYKPAAQNRECHGWTQILPLE